MDSRTDFFTKDAYEKNLAVIKAENDLINQRLSWGMMFQAILFAAIFIGAGDGQGLLVTQEKVILTSLGAIGSFSILLGTLAAHYVIRGKQNENMRFENEGKLSAGSGRNSILFTIAMPHFCLPLLSLACWVYIAALAAAKNFSGVAESKLNAFTINFSVLCLGVTLMTTLALKKIYAENAKNEPKFTGL